MALRLPRRPSCAPSLSHLTPQTCAPSLSHNSIPCTASSSSSSSLSPSVLIQQTRNARLIRRPRRPYMFTQLVALSDGSTYTQRTTNPNALYKSTKDTRNHALWNPSEKALRNVEVDEAGKLAAFRGRFGRGWDAPARSEDGGEDAAAAQDAPLAAAAGEQGAEPVVPGKKKASNQPAAGIYDLGDLISMYGNVTSDEAPKKEKVVVKDEDKKKK